MSKIDLTAEDAYEFTDYRYFQCYYMIETLCGRADEVLRGIMPDDKLEMARQELVKNLRKWRFAREKTKLAVDRACGQDAYFHRYSPTNMF